MNPNLTQEAWDAELANHRNRGIVPKDLTPEQAKQQAAGFVTLVLTSLCKSYANQVRKKANQAPIRIRIPEEISRWISDKVEDVDDFSGNMGSKTYQTLANKLLAELRAFEHDFTQQKQSS